HFAGHRAGTHLSQRVHGRDAHHGQARWPNSSAIGGSSCDVSSRSAGRTGLRKAVSVLRHVVPDSVVTGLDFSTGSVKGLAFDLQGQTRAEVHLPTDLWTEGGVSELNLMQLEGQARASTRAMAARLRELGRLKDWIAGGISATHHTSGRVDSDHVQVRRV